MDRCTHLDSVKVTALPAASDGCVECLAAAGTWCHLRLSLTCGHVGCCDDSPNRHATAHAAATGHPLIRSIEPGEQWSWCFVDEVAMRIDGVVGEPTIPPSPMGCP